MMEFSDTSSVLILGAKGMLGRELVRVFSSGSYEVTAWDREELDLANEREVREKISELWPDIIINAAAYNAVDLCEQDDAEHEKARAINAIAPGILADAANDLRAVIVHFSTDYVFDGERPEYRGAGRAPGCCGSGCSGCSYRSPSGKFDGYREHDKPKPLSRYGKTKYEGELAVEKGTDQHYIIRLSRLFGAPAIADGAKKSFFDAMLERVKAGEEVKAVDDEVSCFTYAPDVAEKTRELVEMEEESPFGIYHITNAGEASWHEAAIELFRIAGISAEIAPVSGGVFARPAKRPAKSTLINTKTEPLRDWREALRAHMGDAGTRY